jgi:hypothetical protein
VVGVPLTAVERAFPAPDPGPDLDSMYREWAAYSVPNDEEVAEREGP